MNTSICSHTIVRNGRPFLDLVLRQVEPFVERMLITISEKSDDGSLEDLRKLEHDFPQKVRIYFENVRNPAELTKERQKQVENTLEDWILFLDDDDYWPESSLKEMQKHLNTDVDGYGINPYQVIDQYSYDDSWRNKWFTKWFRNKNINYRGDWPRDMIWKGDEMLYWRTNPRVVRIPEIKYFHLSNIKNWSFRNEKWAKEFKQGLGSPREYPEEAKKEIWKIYDRTR